MTTQRAGAEVLRMRSMWDSIETHCWPVDRLAAIVISSGAYWQDGIKTASEFETQKTENKRLTIEDAVNITLPPYGETKDIRGLRSQNYVVVGFSHYKTEYTNRFKPSYVAHQKASGREYMGKNFNNKDDRKPRNIPAWFVMHRMGEVVILKSKPSMKRKLQIIERCGLERVRQK